MGILRGRFRWLILLLLAVVLVVVRTGGIPGLGLLTAAGQTTVTKVIDGDTIETYINGKSVRVRYIGIDTPERGECYYREATTKNKELVEGKTISLEKDITDTDRYGRLLRYVYVDGTSVNGELVRLGYARAKRYPPDIKHQDELERFEKEAKSAGLGLWTACR